MNSSPATLPAPTCASEDIRIFCDVVFGYLDGFAPIRMFAETGTAKSKPKVLFQSTSSAAQKLIELAPTAAQEKRGLYVVPGTRAVPGSAGEGDVVETGVLVIDIDGGAIAGKRQHLELHLGCPSLTVASGGVTQEGQRKLHLCWRLTEAARGADLKTVRVLRATVARKAGGDPYFARMHPPIRVAGSIHGKNGNQTPVRILADTHREYHLAELVKAVKAMPALAGAPLAINTGRGSRNGPIPAELATRLVREGGVDGAGLTGRAADQDRVVEIPSHPSDCFVAANVAASVPSSRQCASSVASRQLSASNRRPVRLEDLSCMAVDELRRRGSHAWTRSTGPATQRAVTSGVCGKAVDARRNIRVGNAEG